MTLHPRQALAAFGWSFAQSWGSQLTKLAVFMVLARLLDARDIGLVAFAMVFIQGAHSFALVGVTDALLQAREARPATVNAVFWFNLAVAVALAAALFLFAPLMETGFRMEGLADVLRWICLGLVLNALAAVQVVQFQRQMQMRAVALRDLVAAVVGGVAGIAAALNGLGVYALVVSLLVGNASGVLLLWLSSDWRPSFHVEWKELANLVAFGMHRTGSALLAFVNTRLDDLFIGAFLGPVALGYYAVAYRILMAVNQTTTGVMSRAAFPVFARLQDDPAPLRRTFEAVSRVAAVAAFGLFGLAFVLAPQIIQLAFGPTWSASVPVMKVLCLAGVCLNLVHLNRILLGAVGRADREFYTYLAQAVLCSIGFYFAGQIGIIAFAWVLAGVLAALVPVCVFLSRGSGAVSAGAYFSGLVIPAAGAVVAVAVAGWTVGLVPPQLLLQFAAGTLAFGAIYGLAAGIALRGQFAALKSLVLSPTPYGIPAKTCRIPQPTASIS